MYEQIPTGPAIVIVLSLLFAPKKGILATKRAHYLRKKEYSSILDKHVTR